MENIVTIILLSFTGLLGLIGAILGCVRGIGRQAIRTATVLVSAVLAVVFSLVASNAVLDRINEKTPEEIMGIIERAGVRIQGTDYEGLVRDIDPTTISSVFAIPLALIIIPIVFVILFLLLKLIMIIVHKIISNICGFTKARNSYLTRALGALLGAVQGVGVALIVVAPVSGACALISDTVTEIRAYEDEEYGASEIVSFYDENMARYVDDPVVKLMGNLGGKFIYRQLTTVELREEKHNINDEMRETACAVSISCTKLGGMDPTLPMAKNKEGLVELVEVMGKTPFAKALMLDLLEGLSDAHNSGAFVLTEDELLAEATDAAFEVMGNITEDSFEADLNAILDAYYILGREGALTAFTGGELETVRNSLIKTYVPHELDPKTPSDDLPGDVSVLKKVTEILGTNEHTQPIVTALSKISLSVLATNLGSDLPVDEIYENVKDGLTTTLSISKDGKTEDEYKSEVRASIDNALKSSDIDFREDEQYILDNMADYVWDNYDQLVTTDENGEPAVSDEQINEVILSYYDAYLAGEEVIPEE
ncbi:MAG: hypothetical protein IJD51_00225 [Clostridia bacterium]|nr:hypothetical protein [Clostridia bacterium]